MSANEMSLTAEGIEALSASARTNAAPSPVFWLALLCATLLHAAFIVGLGRSSSRHLGDPSGATDAINVEIVDAAALREMTTPDAPVAPPGPAAPPATAPPPPAAETAPAQPAPLEPDATKAPDAADVKASQGDAPRQEATAEVEVPDTSTPEAIIAEALKSEAKKEEARKEAQRKAEAKRSAKPSPKLPDKLDLSMPFDMTMASGGGSTATRPPGITRSGENDRFGHDVIRALKRMMPPSRDMRGRVTVRLFLNERGNIARLELVQSTGHRDLNHDVMFSIYQTSFPFPPRNATVADRTFLVTYVYR